MVNLQAPDATKFAALAEEHDFHLELRYVPTTAQNYYGPPNDMQKGVGVGMLLAVTNTDTSNRFLFQFPVGSGKTRIQLSIMAFVAHHFPDI
jgi:hypothetical protein